MSTNPVQKTSFRTLTRGLGRTLFLSLLCFSLLPLIFTAWLNYQKSRSSLYGIETKKLEASLHIRSLYFSSYFQERMDDLTVLAGEDNNVSLLSELSASFERSNSSLDRFLKSSDYARIILEYGENPKKFLKISGSRDLLFMDTRGNILYSVAAEKDLGTNIVHGPYKDTEVARVYRIALETGEAAFSDLSYYEPSNNQEAIFGANVVTGENGEKIGILVIQLNIGPIDTIMSDSTGLGETGQIFLVGRDGTLRSKLRSDPSQKSLSHSVDNPLVVSWLAEEKKRQRGVQFDHEKNIHEGFQFAVYSGSSGNKTIGVSSNLVLLENDSLHLLMVAEIDIDEVYLAAEKQMRTSLMVLFVTAGLVTLLAIILTRRLTIPLGYLTNWARQAASGGDLTVQNINTPNNEIGALYESLKTMVRALQAVESGRDERDWLKTGAAEIHTAIQGKQDIVSLGQASLSCLASYLDFQVGAFFVMDNNSLRLSAGYAYRGKKDSPESFKLGEGVVGQAALDKKSILLNNIPDDHLGLEICSGLGGFAPRSILAVPLIHDNETKGVLEFAALHDIAEREVSFLENIAGSIAVVIHAALSREQLALLLEESQTQAEELVSQQEELRQTNEELEEQTHLLGEQKKSLNSQNIALNRAREEVEKKAEEIAIASRYKSEFLANMSHELRTPLNSILLLSRHLSNNKDANMTEKQIECAATVHSSGSELLNLINEILDLARVESGKMALELDNCFVEDITSAMERNFQPVADSKGIEYRVKIAADMPESFRTDCQRLSQIIKNLLSNAFKFTENGSVIFEICMRDGELPVTFMVKDSGIGISDDKVETIFHAFQQEDGSISRKYGGTGLGLSISRELAALLGGCLDVTSSPGRGSVFTLSLPGNGKVKNAQSSETALSSDSATYMKRKVNTGDAIFAEPVAEIIEYVPDDRKEVTKDSRSILIIEDDMDFAKILRDTAREKGFKALIAESGETGLQLTELYEPDGIILDMGLPGMDGKGILFRLKDNLGTRHIPVHIISAIDKTIEPMHMGAVGYLTKPVSMEAMDTVFSRIERVLSKEVKKILVVEDDEVMQQEITTLLGNGIVKTTTAATGAEAKALLEKENFDCIILDLGLPDMKGTELLKELKRENDFYTPVIVHTARELTTEERKMLDSLADSIVVKNVKSMDKLLDESSLFIHRVAADIPEEKREVIRRLHDREAILENKKILIVDDDMRNVFSLVSILEEKGMNTVVAENGLVALTKLQENPDIDLVLMDIMMPEMDGYEAMREIRKMNSKLASVSIIALTAKAMKGDRTKCIEAGASDYLSKPVDADKLFSMLRVWLY